MFDDAGPGTRRAFLGGLAATALGSLLPAVPAQARPGPLRFSAWTGGPTPPLVLADAKGREYDLAAQRGKLVIVNFWATWCEPCRDEMPSLEALQERFGSRSLVVLAVNMEESPAKVGRFLDATLLQNDGLTVLYDSFGTVAKRWKARLLPVTFIIGTDGRVRYWLLGEADWMSPDALAKIEPLLPGKAAR